MTERLQKLLAGAGHGSRRGIEEWIRAGRVTINDRVAALGDRATGADRICLDGRPLDLGGRKEAAEVLLYHKPVGEVTTRSDPEGRPTVFDHLPQPASGRWIVVGRLDVNTSGLLLFTNDGELAHRLMHPSSEVQREYLVRLRGSPTAAVLERLRLGVELEDGPANFDAIETESTEGSHSWIRVRLHEGRNREVRRLFEHEGFVVSRLSRIRYGSVELPRDLRAGGFKGLTGPEIAELSRLAAAASKTSAPVAAE
ncbi:MAG TPA: pseudouridine synthase [Steroidobacteraceae bacterium]|jgi:23S rRNA pseudouridine2605 synthase|nr:pseudouridine synthase [Steroidobacteraceae bacterium]